jgi:hypothetical protein
LCIPDFYFDTVKFVQIAPSGIDDNIIPNRSFLSRNYPNPFNATTVIEFYLDRPTNVTIDIFNILGQKVAALAKGEFPAGKNRIAWEATNQPSGLYFYVLTTGDTSERGKMVLLK